MGPGLKQAKEGHTLGPITLNLFYATDFVDRFESQILPALRAGFVVLTDRYIYSLMARAMVRGADPGWIRSIYGLALKPDAVFYLRIGIDDLIPRVLQRGGFNHWESGMDMHFGEDLFDSFVNYQSRLLKQFDEYGTGIQLPCHRCQPSRRTNRRTTQGSDFTPVAYGVR